MPIVWAAPIAMNLSQCHVLPHVEEDRKVGSCLQKPQAFKPTRQPGTKAQSPARPKVKVQYL